MIQIPVSTRPTRAHSSSNLLSDRPTRAHSTSNLLDDDPNHRRLRSGSDSPAYGRGHRRGHSASPERNGHGLALMSDYKRLPHQDAPDKPIRTTLVKKKQTDGEGLGILCSSRCGQRALSYGS